MLHHHSRSLPVAGREEMTSTTEIINQKVPNEGIEMSMGIGLAALIGRGRVDLTTTRQQGMYEEIRDEYEKKIQKPWTKQQITFELRRKNLIELKLII